MQTWKIYYFIFWLAGIGNLLCRETEHNDWDILIFTQSWPVTVCLQWKEEDENHTCSYPQSRKAWTVHGIWPTILGTYKPHYCNSSWKFDEKKIMPIENELNRYWPNIHSGMSKYSLWEHEWDKHGTCAASLPELDSEEKYFKQGIEWAKKYDLGNILAQAGIDPSLKELTVKTIAESVKAFIQKDPAIECIRDLKTGQEYLIEIRICFDKNLELIDCDGIKINKGESNLPTNCPQGQTVHYPDRIPKLEHWYLTALKFITYLQWFTL